MMRLGLFAAVLAMAGCTAKPAPVPAPAPSPTPSAAGMAELPVDPLGQLVDQWQVETVGGAVAASPRMVLVIGEDWWHAQSQCIWTGGDFRLADGVLRFGPVARQFPSVAGREQAPFAMCARGLTPAEQEVGRVMAGTASAWSVVGDTLTIETPGGALVARRLAEPVANPMEYTDFNPATTFGSWRVAALDGQPVADAELVQAGRLRTLRSGCAYYQWLAWSDMMGNAEMARREPFRSGCAIAESAAERALVGAFEAVTATAADGPDARVWSGPGGTIRLER